MWDKTSSHTRPSCSSSASWSGKKKNDVGGSILTTFHEFVFFRGREEREVSEANADLIAVSRREVPTASSLPSPSSHTQHQLANNRSLSLSFSSACPLLSFSFSQLLSSLSQSFRSPDMFPVIKHLSCEGRERKRM